ncbi:MAG: 2-hydroxyacyl-CoA dehydratase, partial [Candidatus Ancillula sp.]|nr:2-hydroxyacyl-CoA dehydratase [Candidatus Ancillula sp.]
NPGLAKPSAAELDEHGIDIIYPYFTLKEKEHTALRVYQEFARFGVSKEEAAEAVRKGYEEDKNYKQDIINEGKRAIEYAKEHNLMAVVLAGRPYHVDPEINHGIPEAITALKMVVLSEDAVAGMFEQAVDKGEMEKIIRPLRVVDQWGYHSRLYKSAAFVAQYNNQDNKPSDDSGQVSQENKLNIKLVQLNSFGCGLDAVTTDQTAEILQHFGDIYTVLKIDEVSNLGAAKIRLRSLKAAAEERDNALDVEALKNTSKNISQNKSIAIKEQQKSNNLVGKVDMYGKSRGEFTVEMKNKNKIICPQMHPVPFRLIQPIFSRMGYDLDVLEKVTKEDIEVGLRYVNNDSCYPAIIVIGQLVNAFESGKYDPAHTSVIISQTGGMCRATNYASLLRLALANAGYGDVIVFTISTQGLEKHSGFKLGPSALIWAIRALFLGDLLQELILRTRPYEQEKGAVDAVYWKWNSILCEWIGGKRRGSYKKFVKQIVKDFDSIPLKNVPRKPRVGVVGEILVKYHPDANNHVLDVIEAEGCEAVLPGMIEFMTNKLYIAHWNWNNIARGSKAGTIFKPLATKVVDMYRRPIIAAYSKSSKYQGSQKFKALGDMDETIRSARTVTSIGVQAGEGWLLTGEIIELIKHGTPNVVCANPFACLPNHVTGRGMFQEIRRQHPEANIVSIDYDPGASEVNQLNRIKLMITTAKENHFEKGAV